VAPLALPDRPVLRSQEMGMTMVLQAYRSRMVTVRSSFRFRRASTARSVRCSCRQPGGFQELPHDGVAQEHS